MPVRGEFLQGDAGPLALVSWRPDDCAQTRFAVLHVPAFGDEMNKSRRMVSLQARAFAALGGATFVLDPRGTGDSGGNFDDATWDGWRADVALAWRSVRERHAGVPCVLWGLRFGALLACDCLATASVSPDALLLWQPVISGKHYFRQLLRLAQTRAWWSPAGRADAVTGAPASGTIEIGGYNVDPALIGAADAIDLGQRPAPACPVILRESFAGEFPRQGGAAAKLASDWARHGRIDLAAVRGPSFWASVEIEESPLLIASTSAAIAEQCGLAPPSC